MHESGEGCTFLSALAFIAKFVFCRGREATSHERGKTRPKESAMARIWGVEVCPVNNCLMTTVLGAGLFRENELSRKKACRRSRLALTASCFWGW